MFAPGAGRFLGPVAVGAVGVALLGALGIWTPLGVPLLFAVGLAALVGFFAWFFRDPDRTPGPDIVSSADGRVRAVEVEGDRLVISVFMNVTNVHVNRFPLAATVREVSTSGAGHRPAYRADAHHNVQRAYRLDTAIGEVEVVQMTGILARRLVAFVAPGDRREKGARLGMIVLGSRVDVRLPADRTEAVVKVGAPVHAGTTAIARERS